MKKLETALNNEVVCRNEIDRWICRSFHKQARNAQIKIADIPKIYDECRIEFLMTNSDMDSVVARAIARHQIKEGEV